MLKIIMIVFMMFSSLFSNSLNLTKKELEYIKKHPSIKVSNENDWLPFDFHEKGVAKGYSVDIIKTLAKKIGIKVEFINGYTWSELLKLFKDDKIDMMHVITKSAKREKLYSYSKPYIHWQASYFIRSDDNSIKSTEDFEGKRLAVGKGWDSTKLLKKKYPKAIFLEYETTSDMVNAVSLNNADVIIDTVSSISYTIMKKLIVNLKLGGHIDISKDNFDQSLYFMSHKHSFELVSIFSKAFDSLSLAEKLNIQKKWFGDAIDNNIRKSTTNISEDELIYLKNKKEIKVCVDPDWMPFSAIIDGKYRGMDAEFLEIFKKSLKIPMTIYKTNSWKDSLLAIKNKKCDVITLASKTKLRSKYLNFTTPYLYASNVIVTKKGTKHIFDLNYLKNEKIATVKGYSAVELMKEKYKNLIVVEVNSIKEGLQKVENGEVYGYMDNAFTINYYFKKGSYSDFKIIAYVENRLYLALGVRDDDLTLLDIMQKAVNSVSEQQIKAITEKGLITEYKKLFDYTLIWQIIIISIVIVIFFIYRDITIKKSNKKLEIKNQEIEQLLKEKNILLKEVYHRVKNNFQMVISMLGLESYNIKDKKQYNYFLEIINRLKSISLVHEFLYNSESLSQIQSQEYLLKIIEQIKFIYSNKTMNIKTNIQAELLDMDQAIIIGMITNEIVNNAMKHHHKDICNIEFSFINIYEEQIELKIIDDGLGFDEETVKKSDGLGLSLIKDFAQKLSESKIEFKSENNTSFRLTFKST